MNADKTLSADYETSEDASHKNSAVNLEPNSQNQLSPTSGALNSNVFQFMVSDCFCNDYMKLKVLVPGDNDRRACLSQELLSLFSESRDRCTRQINSWKPLSKDHSLSNSSDVILVLCDAAAKWMLSIQSIAGRLCNHKLDYSEISVQDLNFKYLGFVESYKAAYKGGPLMVKDDQELFASIVDFDWGNISSVEAEDYSQDLVWQSLRRVAVRKAQFNLPSAAKMLLNSPKLNIIYLYDFVLSCDRSSKVGQALNALSATCKKFDRELYVVLIIEDRKTEVLASNQADVEISIYGRKERKLRMFKPK